jgi:uncharacterized protein (DUF2062 family)
MPARAFRSKGHAIASRGTNPELQTHNSTTVVPVAAAAGRIAGMIPIFAAHPLKFGKFLP